MFKRILNPTSLAIFLGAAVGLTACGVQKAEVGISTPKPAKVWGEFPTKPVPVEALDENSQFLMAFNELSRVNRNTMLTLRPYERNSRVGCIYFKLTEGSKTSFLIAEYTCFLQDLRKSMGLLVREERGKETFQVVKNRTEEKMIRKKISPAATSRETSRSFSRTYKRVR